MSMTPLERNYWILVSAAYPREFTESRGAELVSTLLDAADTDQRRPSLGEAADLIKCGVAERARLYGSDARAQGRAMTSAMSSFLLAAIATTVISIQALPDWRTPLPVGFSLWLVPVLALVLYVVRPLLLAKTSPLFVFGAAAASVLGPSSIMVPRMWLLAVIWLGLTITMVGSHPSIRIRRVSVAMGSMFGLATTACVISMSTDSTVFLTARQTWSTPLRFWVPAFFYWTWPLLLVGLFVLLWVQPAVAMATAVVAMPLLLVLQSVGVGGFWNNATTMDNATFAAATAIGVTAALVFGMALTLRPRHAETAQRLDDATVG